MIKKYDSLKAGLKPLLAKTLQNSLAHRISKEFPRIGGPRICKLCAEMIMEVVDNHIRSKDYVTLPTGVRIQSNGLAYQTGCYLSG